MKRTVYRTFAVARGDRLDDVLAAMIQLHEKGLRPGVQLAAVDGYVLALTGDPAPVEQDPNGPKCPLCGSEMWDNRESKRNPKAPDFKCKRNREGCDGVIWPPRAAAPKGRKGPPPKEPHSLGSVPGLDEGE